jgi:hypothetical protein
MSDRKHLVLIGGGNSTAILAVLAKRANHRVTILTRSPEKWSGNVKFTNQDQKWLPEVQYHETVDMVTADHSVVADADIIFIAGAPIHCNEEILRKIKPWLSLSKQIHIGTICAYGGFNWLVDDIFRGYDVVPFGTQLIPWCCGTVEYGSHGIVYGAKDLLRIVTRFGKDETGIRPVMERILCQPTEDTSFMASLFWPNNLWLHPPILYGLFKDWDGESYYDVDALPKKIYAEMSEESGQVMETLDTELRHVVHCLSEMIQHDEFLKLNYSLEHNVKLNYGTQVGDGSTIQSTVMTCKAFGQHRIPYEPDPETVGRIRPIKNHKFFLTDLPYGLVPVKNIAILCGCDTPMMDDIIYWNQRINGKEYMVDGKLVGRDIGECIYHEKFKIEVAKLNE